MGEVEVERQAADDERNAAAWRAGVAGVACRSFHASVSTALMTAIAPQQPGYLSHCHAAATPTAASRSDKPSSSVMGSQRLPSQLLSVPNQSCRSPSAVSTATAKASSSAFPVGPFFARSTAWASNAERRAACLTDC